MKGRPIRPGGFHAIVPATCCCGDVAACVLAAPAAHAFTVENKDEGGQYGMPKFNLEEQMKNFRKDGSDASSTGKNFYETPLGPGKLQFGVTQGPASGFGSVFSPGFGPASARAPRGRTSTVSSRRRLRWNTTAFAEGG